MNKVQYLFVSIMLGLISTNLSAQSAADDLYKKSQQQFSVGNYAEALKNNIEALKIIEEGENCGLIANGNMQVGKMHYFLRDKRTALKFFFKSYRLADSCNVDSIKQRSLFNIGVVYTELEKIDSALLYLNQAKSLLENSSNYADLSRLNAVIADLHLNRTHNLELAKKHIDEAEKYADKTSDLGGKAFVQIKYSIYYKLKKNYPLSIKYARAALAYYDKAGATEGRIYGMKVLGDILALSGDPEAKDVFNRLLVLKDSIFHAETANKIANYQTLYETDKKEKENNLLLQKNRISQLQIGLKNKTIIGLVICILLIIMIVFWRMSVINLKKKQRELEAQQKMQIERERISSDLHDNVGGQLSYVLFSLEADEELTSEKRKERSVDLASSIRSVTRNLRETIWALNQEKITLKNLSDKLKLYTRNMFNYSTTKIKFEENIVEDDELNPALALNLFRICQEIVNNAFKHSKATELIVSIERKEKIKIMIFDNGIGFDKNNVQENSHYGLSNLHKRASEIKGELIIDSALDKGSRITLVV